MFLEKGTADIFRQRGSDWEGLSKTVNSCCHRHLRNCLVFPIICWLSLLLLSAFDSAGQTQGYPVSQERRFGKERVLPNCKSSEYFC